MVPVCSIRSKQRSQLIFPEGPWGTLSRNIIGVFRRLETHFMLLFKQQCRVLSEVSIDGDKYLDKGKRIQSYTLGAEEKHCVSCALMSTSWKCAEHRARVPGPYGQGVLCPDETSVWTRLTCLLTWLTHGFCRIIREVDTRLCSLHWSALLWPILSCTNPSHLLTSRLNVPHNLLP